MQDKSLILLLEANINNKNIQLKFLTMNKRTSVEFSNFIQNLEIAYLVMEDDYNGNYSYWDWDPTRKGRVLNKSVIDNNCEPLSTSEITYWPSDPNNISRPLDFYITKNINSNFLKIE